jgi:hypothetical protein
VGRNFLNTGRENISFGEIYDVRKKLLNYFEGKPFLLIYAAGEYVYEPKIGLQYLQESIASSLFKVPK